MAKKKAARKKTKSNANGANLGFEAKLWLAADIAIYGQESNPTTRRLGPEHADSFRRDLHKDLKADYVLANPPFNDSDWVRNDEDVRWRYPSLRE